MTDLAEYVCVSDNDVRHSGDSRDINIPQKAGARISAFFVFQVPLSPCGVPAPGLHACPLSPPSFGLGHVRIPEQGRLHFMHVTVVVCMHVAQSFQTLPTHACRILDSPDQA